MLITTSCFFTNPMRKIVKRRKFPTPLQHTPLSPSLLSRNSLNARKVEKDFASAALLWLGPGGFLLQKIYLIEGTLQKRRHLDCVLCNLTCRYAFAGAQACS